MPTATMAAPAAAKAALTMPGGWTHFDFTLSTKAKEIFRDALKGFVGVHYTPLAAATQVVAGTNWCYLAKGTLPGPSAFEDAYLLYIFEPLEGPPHLTEITRIKPA